MKTPGWWINLQGGNDEENPFKAQQLLLILWHISTRDAIHSGYR
jgi:hypothetical protein